MRFGEIKGKKEEKKKRKEKKQKRGTRREEEKMDSFPVFLKRQTNKNKKDKERGRGRRARNNENSKKAIRHSEFSTRLTCLFIRPSIHRLSSSGTNRSIDHLSWTRDKGKFSRKKAGSIFVCQRSRGYPTQCNGQFTS